MTDAPKQKSLVEKLCEVMAVVERIPKRGYNRFNDYKYVLEADLADALRKELASRKVLIFPNVLTVSRQLIPPSEKNYITEIMVRWTFVDGETGDSHSCDIPGSGQDTLDKGVYKALTGSEKYLLMKTFLVPTGDDPENDSSGEAEQGKAAAQQVAADKIAAYKEKAAASVSDKVVVVYSITAADHTIKWCFEDGPAFRLLLDAGLPVKTNEEHNVKYIDDQPLVWELVDKVASSLHITIKKRTEEEATKSFAAKPAKAPWPVIVSAKRQEGKSGGEFLAIKWGGTDCSCWDSKLWEIIEAGVGQVAELLTIKKGKYINVIGVHQIGDTTFSVVDGKLVPDIRYKATDDDLPPMFK